MKRAQDMAARVHDSVLQTLALIQRHADEPRRVASLARRQERELRGWLYGDKPLGDETASMVVALSAAAGDIEELHGVRVELASAGCDMALYPLSAFRAMNKAALNVYSTLRKEGTQQAVVDTMQTREELYQYLGYHDFEKKLDALFAKAK